MVQAIDATTPQGDGTPTGDAIHSAVRYLAGLQTPNRKFIVLATDGEPSCSPSGEGGEEARPYAIGAVGEAFAAGIPVTWTIVNGGTGGGAAATWTTANPGGRSSASPMAVPTPIVDSDFAGSGATQDVQLITRPIDLSAANTATVEFDEYFYYYSGSGNEKGDVDVRSSRTGGAWVNVLRHQGASTANTTVMPRAARPAANRSASRRPYGVGRREPTTPTAAESSGRSRPLPKSRDRCMSEGGSGSGRGMKWENSPRWLPTDRRAS